MEISTKLSMKNIFITAIVAIVPIFVGLKSTILSHEQEEIVFKIVVDRDILVDNKEIKMFVDGMSRPIDAKTSDGSKCVFKSNYADVKYKSVSFQFPKDVNVSQVIDTFDSEMTFFIKKLDKKQGEN